MRGTIKRYEEVSLFHENKILKHQLKITDLKRKTLEREVAWLKKQKQCV